MAWIRKGTLIHVDGSIAIEKLWRKEVEAENGGGYEVLKRTVGAKVGREVAEFLGYTYPGILDYDLAPAVPGTPDHARYHLVCEFCNNIKKPKLVGRR